MGRRKRKTATITIDQLTPKGMAGPIESGQIWTAKGASLGDTVLVRQGKKSKGTLLEITEPSKDRVPPPCPLFLHCGGCQLQHMSLNTQRTEKEHMVSRIIDRPHVVFHPIQGTGSGYAYRNKLELSFGTRLFLKEEQLEDETIQIQGDFLGMHPWGWYSKVVSISECLLISDSMNRTLKTIQSLQLEPAWNNRSHEGVWRHVILREGNGIWVTFVTSPDANSEQLQHIATLIKEDNSDIKGVLWVTSDRLSDVAIGDLRAVLYGTDQIEYTLFGKELRVPHDGFFQVNTAGTESLLQILSTLYEGCNGKLFDLYCGVGTLGIALSSHFTSVLGVEEHPLAITMAKLNAQSNGVSGDWIAGKVESVLDVISNTDEAHILLDPPRSGLHPKVAKKLSLSQAKSLVYVACSPLSFARDLVILEDGGWRLVEVWTVDLFPQTPHVECIARLEKTSQNN